MLAFWREAFHYGPAKDARVVLRDPQGKGLLRAELGQIDAEVGRLAAAIAGGGELPALLTALQERERRRVQLRTELAGLNRERTTAGLDAGQILDDLREQLTDRQGMLRQETGPARQALRALLAGHLVFTPKERDEEPFYSFAGDGTVSPVIAGSVALQHVWCPRPIPHEAGRRWERPVFAKTAPTRSMTIDGRSKSATLQETGERLGRSRTVDILGPATGKMWI